MIRDFISQYLFWGIYLKYFSSPHKEIFREWQKKQNWFLHNTFSEFEQLQKEYYLRLLRVHKDNGHYGKIINKIGIPENNAFSIFEHIRKFPLLSKNTIQDNFTVLKNQKANKIALNSSGGSTGTPVNLWQDYNYLVHVFATTRLSDSLEGWFPGCRLARLWGAPKDIKKIEGPIAKIKFWFRNDIWLDSFNMGEERMALYHLNLSRYRPHVILSYASSMDLFARYLEENNISPDYPSVSVITSAETLYDDARERIQRVFGKPVYNRYGSREVGNIGSECSRHSGFHLHPYDHIIEVIDDDENQIFEKPGRIIITSLTNFGMPIIRYEIGDIGTLSNKPCECGINTPLLKKVVGRTSDSIRTREGRIIHGEYFTHIFYGLSGVRRFQFMQESYDNYVVKVQLTHDADTIKIREAIIRECAMVLGNAIRITIEFVDDIPVTTSGKFRFTISKIQTQ